MRRFQLKTLCLIFLCLALLAGCAGEGNPSEGETPSTAHTVTVTASAESVDVLRGAFAEYDFTALFSVTEDGRNVPVLASYLTVEAQNADGSVYRAVCNYGGQTAVVTVNVLEEKLPTVTVLPVKDAVDVRISEVAEYSYPSLFNVISDGALVPVTYDYLDISAVRAEIGSYVVSCTYGTARAEVTVRVIADPEIESGVVINVNKKTVAIRDTDLSEYDFTKLFSIRKEDKTVPVLASYLDLTELESGNDLCRIYCRYEDRSASVTVNILHTQYAITVSEAEITINALLLDTVDLRSYFTFTVDGKVSEVTDAMITTDLLPVAGEYLYTVAFEDKASATLRIHVIEERIVELYTAGTVITVPVDQLASYPFESLFTVYVDKKVIPTEKAWVDTSAVTSSLTEGDRVPVTFLYESEGKQYEASVTVAVGGASVILLDARDVSTYPNSGRMDLTSLFRITKDGEDVPVTADMISGTVDYHTEGEYPITLTYGGQTVTAIVSIRLGVIIGYAPGVTVTEDAGETIGEVTVLAGTNRNAYCFSDDFEVIINGILFRSLPGGCVNFSAVDFSTPGVYEAILTIPYNDSKDNIKSGFGGTRVNFAYVTAKIRYRVVEEEILLSVRNEKVVLPVGSTTYSPIGNLRMTVNGKMRLFTMDPVAVNDLTCLVKIVSAPIDFTDNREQTVTAEVYAHGVDCDPLTISFTVTIPADVVVKGADLAVFSGSTVHPRDLFTITASGKPVQAEDEMVTGAMDLFTPGTYRLTLQYGGVTGSAVLTVLDHSIVGKYRTTLTTVYEDIVIDDEGNETVVEKEGSVYPTMEIRADGTITWGKQIATRVTAKDSYHLDAVFGSLRYSLNYENGFLSVEPDNSARMAFSGSRRPLVYVHEEVWTVKERATLNGSERGHVLSLSSSKTYSIDMIGAVSKADETVFAWYGTYIYLLERSASDTYYEVAFGEVTFEKEWKTIPVGEVSSLTFGDTVYSFTKKESRVATVLRNTDTQAFDGTYTGDVNGESAVLTIGNGGMSISCSANGKSLFSVSSFEVSNMKNGGVDRENGSVLVYLYNERNRETYSDGEFSYKFLLDPVQKKFTYVQRDRFFGRYVCEDMNLFLDGYGTGLVNFNTKSGVCTPFAYEASADGQSMRIRYRGTVPDFAYGKETDFSIPETLNLLTVRSCKEKSFIGKQFKNVLVTEGALVEISEFCVPVSSKLENTDFYQNLRIVTKDGDLTPQQMASVLDLRAVAPGVAGFYRFSVTVDVCGTPVTCFYTLQVLGSIYRPANYPVVSTEYHSGVTGIRSFSLDEYGRVAVTSSGVLYTGLASIDAETQTVSAKLYSRGGTSVTVTGTYLFKGLLRVTVSGADSFTDYFTTGAVRLSGNGKQYLRRFICEGGEAYFLTHQTVSVGEEATVTSLNGKQPSDPGAVLQLDTASGTVVVKVNAWDPDSGLVFSDLYRGTYTRADGENLVLDGFGGALLGSRTGSYTIGSEAATVTFDDTGLIGVYRLDQADGTYTEVEAVLDESLVSSKVYKREFSATGKDSEGNTVTKTLSLNFSFAEGGVVTVACHNGGLVGYSVVLIGTGTYTVNQNLVSVEINGYSLEFRIVNVLNPTRLSCTRTNMSKTEDGYFAEGAVFVA